MPVSREKARMDELKRYMDDYIEIMDLCRKKLEKVHDAMVQVIRPELEADGLPVGARKVFIRKDADVIELLEKAGDPNKGGGFYNFRTGECRADKPVKPPVPPAA